MSAACFVSGGVAPAAALQALLSHEPSVSLAGVDLVCCGPAAPSSSAAQATKYAVGVAASRHPHSRNALAQVARSLQPGGRLYVYEALTEVASDSGRAEALHKDLLLSGFDAFRVLPSADATTALLVSAQLPQWALGSSAKLSLKRPQPTAAAKPQAAPAPAPAKNAWKLAAVDDEDEELVDDEQLLTAEDKAAAVAAKPDDCEVGATGRKACKNCSCGRADAEASGAAVMLAPGGVVEAPESACGNCYLGDAFRCGTCPYRGLPSFQPGQKVQLGASMLTADV